MAKITLEIADADLEDVSAAVGCHMGTRVGALLPGEELEPGEELPPEEGCAEHLGRVIAAWADSVTRAHRRDRAAREAAAKAGCEPAVCKPVK